MSGHCPKDGGFVGSAGCTHTHHAHSALVRRIVASADAPKMVSASEAEAALREGFHVSNPDGARVGFGRRLLDHIEKGHLKGDADARKTRLAFAVATVAKPDAVERNHRAIPGRTAYARAFDDFGILVVSGKGSDAVEQVFTLVPNRKGKRRRREG